LKNSLPGILTEDRYRTVGEQQIVDMLLVAAFVYELEQTQRASLIARISSALDTWIGLGLGYRISDRGERMFDPVEVVNRMKWAGYHGYDDFWINHFVATGRAFLREWDSVPKSQPPEFKRRGPARFSLHLTRIFNLSGIDVGQKMRLRLPLPLSQASHEIEIEPIIPADLSARITRSEGRLDFQFAVPSDPNVNLAAKISFTTDGYSKDDLTDGSASNGKDVYLRTGEGLIRVTPRIQALSQTLAGPGGNQLANATAFFRHIVDEFMCGMVHYDQVDTDAPGDWVLDSGWYDCQLGSALFVSLCRAHGIPARIMSGHMLYRLAPGFHYWAEVWIDEQGWTPFDFLNWDLSLGGRDADWRNCFVGAIDYRMVTQCFPLAFTGPMSVRFPSAWHLINAPCRGGMEINFTELSGKLIYCDRIASQRQAW
jgi:hypothetical protein